MNGTVITIKGTKLLTKLVASGTPLEFSRVVIGTGKTPEGLDSAGMADLNQYRMDGLIAGIESDGNIASILCQINSIGVSEGFIATEAGVYAIDPNEGEILYAYIDMSDDPQYVYAEGGVTSKFIELTLGVVIGNVKNITAILSPSSLVTKKQFDETIQSIENPVFDDMGNSGNIKKFEDFIDSVVSKMSISNFFKNLKTAIKFVLHKDMLVNHGDETVPGKPLDACFGKTVNDKVGKIIDDINNKSNKLTSLPNGTDIFQYADNAPILTDIWCRVYASPQYPLGYNQDNDIWFHVLKLHNDKYWKVIAHDIRTDRIFAISKINGVMTKWTESLSTEKLANNGTTTASGFALDARFGKLLQDQVSVINTNLANKANTGHTHSDYISRTVGGNRTWSDQYTETGIYTHSARDGEIAVGNNYLPYVSGPGNVGDVWIVEIIRYNAQWSLNKYYQIYSGRKRYGMYLCDHSDPTNIKHYWYVKSDVL